MSNFWLSIILLALVAEVCLGMWMWGRIADREMAKARREWRVVVRSCRENERESKEGDDGQ